VLENIAGWQRPQIRAFFESYGFLVQEWERVSTDWLTLRAATDEQPRVAAAGAQLD